MTKAHKHLSVLTLLLVGIHSAPTAHNATQWTACTAPLPSNLECTTVSVPMDYSGKRTGELSLNLVKLPARDSAARKGSLVWQFGGPGEVTSDFLISAAEREDLAFGSVQTYYDMIVADPRGNGLNYPVKCDPELARKRLSYFPLNEEEYRNTLQNLEELGKSCVERTGDVIHYMDTQTQARDLEAVRLAIGEGKLNYYGVSWGTMRGFDYAALYPNNVGAMVLDALVDHSLDVTALTASSVHSFSLTQRRMLEWMSTNSSSALKGRDAVRIWRELVRRADEEPIPIPACERSGLCFPEVTSGDLRVGINQVVYHPNSLWALASENIRQAYDNNNASGFAYPYQGETGAGASQLSIICHDWDFVDNWQDYVLLDYMSSTFSLDPRAPTGGQLWNIGCPKWPVEVTNPPKSLRVHNSNASLPILLIHALLDPAVGYDQAIGVHQRIDSSALLTRYGEGHGSLESAEGVEAIEAYFINGTVPDPLTIIGQTMSADVVTDFEIFGWDEDVV